MSNSLVAKVTFLNRASMCANYEYLWALILTKTRLDPKVKYGKFCSRNDILSNDIKNKLKTTKWRYLHPNKGENLHKPAISCIYVHVSLQLDGLELLVQLCPKSKHKDSKQAIHLFHEMFHISC